MSKELFAHESYFQELSRYYSDGIYHCDYSGKLIYVNEKLSTMLGYTQSELVGKTIAELMHSDDVAQNMRLLERMAEFGLPYRLEQDLFCSDGSAVAVKISVLPLRSAADDPKSACAVVINNSDRALKSRLRDTECLLTQVSETIQDVFWISDPRKPKVLYVSPAYEEIWGRSRKDLYRDCSIWIETVHPGDRQRVLKNTPKLRQQERGEIEYRIVRPDGSVRWINDRGFAVRDEMGEIYQIFGVARDISDRKQAELQLQQSNQRLKFLADISIKLVRYSQSDEEIAHLLERLASLLELKYYFYYLLSEKGDFLQLQASKGIDELTCDRLKEANSEKSIEEFVIRSEGRSELKNVQSSSEPRSEIIRNLGITAYVCYALIVKDRAIGTLSFGKDIANSFDAEEITLLRAVTDLVAMALERKQTS